MALKISNKYDDIIHLPRPESKHPHMSNSDRAKIFSPFAALKGHIEAIHEKETPRGKSHRFIRGDGCCSQ